MLSKTQIHSGLKSCMHCSQQVLMEWAQELGYDREEAARMAAPFGGGLFRGDTCGAVAGAMIAIGIKYGNSEPGGFEKDAAMVGIVKKFQEEFTARNGTMICRELIGYDFSKPGEREKAKSNEETTALCIKFIQDSLEILDKIM